ncbi:MAG: SdpI family protein [Thermoflexibacteraceae bacterium]|jgi:uncharacterized membrane protein
MATFNTMSFICLGIIFLMIILPTVFYFFPPKKINPVYGYRTAFSMLNQDTWTEANTYFNRKHLQFATVNFIVSLGLFFVLPHLTLLAIVALSAIIPAFLAMFLTSKHLDNIFNDKGQRR